MVKTKPKPLPRDVLELERRRLVGQKGMAVSAVVTCLLVFALAGRLPPDAIPDWLLYAALVLAINLYAGIYFVAILANRWLIINTRPLRAPSDGGILHRCGRLAFFRPRLFSALLAIVYELVEVSLLTFAGP